VKRAEILMKLQLPFVRALRRGSGVRFSILEILEKNPEGLSVMAIYRCLRENGRNITQPAVSQNLKFLEEKGLVWKTQKFSREVKRKLWHYISAASFYHIVSESLRKEIALALSKCLEENAERAPQFENIQSFLSFLEKISQTVAESIAPSEELYSELSRRKPYNELAPILRDYHSTVANICEIIEAHPSLKRYSQRRVNLNLSSSVAMDSPYDIAKVIVDGALRGEKRYIDALIFLHKNTTGELQKRMTESIEWIRQAKDRSVLSTRRKE